jgi:carbamoyl-phosphate synthase large subunit
MSINVLVTAASRRVPLVRAFKRAVGAAGGRVVVTDVEPLSPAVHMADAAYRVPLSNAPGYLERIQEVCWLERIGLVVPTIDDELPLFGDAVRTLEPLGVRVAVSPAETSRVCNDKFALCERLRSRGIPSARSWLPGNLPKELEFPVFVKPRHGRGSVQAFGVQNQRELDFFLGYVKEPVVQEFLVGPEYTIDLLCGFDRTPLSVVPRERLLIRAGVSDRGRTVADPALLRLATDCAAALEFVGPINIQCRVVGGTPVVFEINPRFSGGIPLTIAAGADFPRMLVELARGQKVAPSIGRFTTDLWMTNYEEAIFLDRAGAAPAETEALSKFPATTKIARQVA